MKYYNNVYVTLIMEYRIVGKFVAIMFGERR